VKHHYPPDIGNWYKDKEYNTSFLVVATDDNNQSVEIQYFAGEVEELDLDTWYELDLRAIPPPDDWSGPYELTHEDLNNGDDATHPEEWSNPLNDIEPEDYS
jgi:hypothetical protein